MSSTWRVVLLLTALLLAGCAGQDSIRLPAGPWYLGFVAPTHMAVWIETADVLDIKDRGFRRVMGGNARMDFTFKPEDGWSTRTGVGSGKYVSGSDLPKLIYVRWQSLAEAQTYEVVIEIPEATRHSMLKPERAYCRLNDRVIDNYRTYVTIGLAPGGVAQTWLRGVCLGRIKVTRTVGRIVPLGPDLGRSSVGYLPLEPESQAYIDAHGIPYGAW
ncbi:DUF2931 family protein [Pseudomonas sp. B21-035]|uniref:DUF2931 family protein n=1 Tax=Pseudomonas sp. B21-035 TaxID=2895484 RepID=UPI002160B590|nr:DUF2931 family protein [Pseudomonas sp. B21-035]UVL54172.1 DUF2931 family protein [Pseudomonas sp. B21-035]